MQSIFQDLNARTSWGGFQQDLHKIFSQGLVRDHVRTPRRFHTRTCTRSWKGIWQHVTGISTRSSHKDMQKTLTKIFMPGPARKAPAAGEDLTRSWHENFPRASQKNFHTSTSKTWHLQDLQELQPMTSWRGSDQDLHKIFWQGPVQDHARTS